MAIRRLPATGDEPRSTGVPASLVPGGSTDSAGYPWAGRSFDHHDSAFADDDGAAPTELREAVANLRTAASHLVRSERAAHAERAAQADANSDSLARAHREALLTLSRCRVLIPLLAEAGEMGVTPEGKPVDKTQELSIVTLAAPDGRRVMPVFSSIDTLRRWRPTARPIPVPMPQAALAAAQEQSDLIIVDPGSPEYELGVRRTQLEDVALGRAVHLPWEDSSVTAAFASAFNEDPRVRGITLAAGDPEARLLTPEVDVVIELVPGLDRNAIDQLLAAAQQQWSQDELIATRVDSLRLRLR